MVSNSMLKSLVAGAALIGFSTANAATVTLFDFSGTGATASSTEYLDASSPTTGATGSSLTVGSGLNFSAAVNSNTNNTSYIDANGANDGDPLPSLRLDGDQIQRRGTAPTLATLLSSNDYIEFLLTPSAGYSIDLTSLSFTSRTGNGATTRAALYFGSFSGTPTSAGFADVIGANNNSFNTYSINLASITGLQDVTSALTLRLYFWDTRNATQNNTTGSTTRIDNLTLAGTVTDPVPVPVPAAAWLLGTALVGMAGIGRRKQV